MIKEEETVGNGTMLPLVEEFFSVQGEGFNTGEAAYFIRIGGCDVGCSWCDSRFAWDPQFFPPVDVGEIIAHAVDSGARAVVVTGGEPLMWNLDLLCKVLKVNNIRTYLETSGAYPLTGVWDWICLSPKRNSPPLEDIYSKANELKVIIEDENDFIWAENNRRLVSGECKLFLQPEWSRFGIVIPEIVKYVKQKPEWRISLQVHKYMHIP